MASFFSTPHELASLVQAAVSQHLQSGREESPASETRSEPITWHVAKDDSPYPGLMHFTRQFARVFFGREGEARELLDRMTLPDGRFLIVSGDSGTGKSSLVDAGVLPRLEESGLPGYPTLTTVRLVPGEGENPFDALLRVLSPYAQRAGLNSYLLGTEELVAHPENLPATLATIVARGMDTKALVLFVDQMEELFTVKEEEKALAAAFLSGLYQAIQTSALWVIATIRTDLLHHCYNHPDLLKVLRGPGHYPLGPMALHRLHEIIVRPARCAGLAVPGPLAGRLIKDVGTEAGNLPLLAFVLRRLFDRRQDNVLSEAVYDDLGVLNGAIADHAASVQRELAATLGQEVLERRLAEIFEALVHADVEGLPTRRSVPSQEFSDHMHTVIDALVKGQLLTVQGGRDKGTVTVAHERLFNAWPALAHWVAELQDELRLLRQGELDAAEWQRHNADLGYLWHTDRLMRLQTVVSGLAANRASRQLRDFAWPQQRLVNRLNEPELTHEVRQSIGRYLAEQGDPRPGTGVTADGIPDIDWVDIPDGRVVLEKNVGAGMVEPFRMARYPITNAQFEAFVSAADGYRNREWWTGSPEAASDGLETPRWPEPNHPRVSVSWYKAAAFCRWLSRRLGFEVWLPTEFEWQQAATGGDPTNVYPWGPEWDARYCNSTKSRLNRTTAVGMYPAGASHQGVLDLAGNVWEWCKNKYDNPDDPKALRVDDSGDSRVLRGGSWAGGPVDLRCADRFRFFPDDRFVDIGFRVVCRPRSSTGR